MLQSAGVQQLRQALYLVNFLGFTQRSQRFNEASRYYWGKQYDHLDDWEDDKPLEEKAPKVRVRLTKSAVDQATQHLFGKGRKPSFEIEKLPEDVRDTEETDEEGEDEEGDEDEASDRLDEINSRLADLYEDSRLHAQLPEVGRLGNLHGTTAVGFHVVDGRVDVEVLHVADAKPTFGHDDRQRAAELGVDFDELLELDEYWREVEEGALGDETHRFHRRIWEPNRTVEYEPIDIEGSEIEDFEELGWTVDEERTVEHDLGFVPVEWIKNLPVAHDIDGQAIVEESEREIEDEINYTLSQTGRGLRYNQEPQVVFTNVDNLQQGSPVKRGSKNTLQLESPMDGEADAKLLELTGQGTEKALKYTQRLREFFHEVTDTIQHDPERAKGALSGTAIKRLMRPLISLVGLERAQYGPKLARLLEKMMEALTGTRYSISVSWPEVVELTPQELLQVVQVARQAWQAGLVTRRKAIDLIAPLVDVDDVEEFIKDLEAEETARQAGGTQGAAEEAFRQAEQNLQDL